MFDFKVESTSYFALSLVEARNDPGIANRKRFVGETSFNFWHGQSTRSKERVKLNTVLFRNIGKR